MSELARPLPDVHITTLGLVLDRDITFEDWASIGSSIGAGHRAFSLAAGDWLVYGERKFPDRYTQMMDATGLSLGRLRNLASTCGRVSIKVRKLVPFKSISHLESVASLSEDHQIQMLMLANEYDIDRDTFRGLAQEVKAGANPYQIAEQDGQMIIRAQKLNKEAVIEQAKHVAYAWRNNASSKVVGMTLHQALRELEEMLGDDL